MNQGAWAGTVEKAVERQADRLATYADLTQELLSTIEETDLPNAT